MQLHQARGAYVQWLLATRELSPHTVRAYASDITALEKHLGHAADLSTICSQSLVSFLTDQRAAGLAARSLRRRVCGLRGFTRWLQARELLGTDPWAGVTLHFGRIRRLPRAVPSHDLEQFLNGLRQKAEVSSVLVPERALQRPNEATTLLAVALMLTTGLRISEVASLSCRDIDLAGRKLRVLGKGLRERHVFLTNDWLISLVRAYLITRETLAITHDVLLFNSHGAPISPPAMRSRLCKASQGAGLTDRITPHMLRHTAATMLIEAGVDIRMVQRLLGHASIATTVIYTHVTDTALRRAVCDADVLSRSLRGAPHRIGADN